MKPIRVILILGAVLVGFVFVRLQRHNLADQAEDKKQHVGEDATDKRWRWEKEAEESQRAQCTNIVGFRRVLESRTRTTDADVSKWTGQATVEFINPMGGVSVTNATFTFLRGFDHVSCYFK